MDRFDILTNRQFGFRKNHQTTHAIIDAVEFIAENLEKKKTVLSIFIDLSKAFDTIDHAILLKKT